MVFASFLVGLVYRRKPPPKDSLESPIRRRLYGIVTKHLGINEKCLEAELGLKRSAVRHHVQCLVESKVLERYPIGRENHYFPAKTEPARMEVFAMANHGRAHKVLRHILLDPGIRQADLAARLGMTRKILRYHLDFLTQQGLVREQRLMRKQHYYPGAAMDQSVQAQVVGDDCPEDGESLPPSRRPDSLTPS